MKEKIEVFFGGIVIVLLILLALSFDSVVTAIKTSIGNWILG
jgi:hypothetical protein